ncbi:MAG: hypothetical protein Q4E54_06015 [Lachnospiraceae bacterium]|nr:hypothetical protein [Lachnospiraceae bacterium]
MGYGIRIKCNTCNYEEMFFMGVGGLFGLVYEKTVKAVRSGKYGAEWQQFFKEHPGAAILCEERLYQCPKCNHLQTNLDLALYLNKDENPPKYHWAHWCDKNHDYEFVKSYVHKCPKCNARMRKINDYRKKTFKCPECGSNIPCPEDGIDWD